jgi:hypothetical protein
MGAGPMTGRAAGYCAGSPTPGYANPYMGFGGGRGWRNMFYATGMPGWLRGRFTAPAPQEDVEMLKQQANWLKDQLDAINRRLQDLDKDAE